MIHRFQISNLFFIGCSCCAYLLLGYSTNRTDFFQLLSLFLFLCFLAYRWLPQLTLKQIFWSGLFFRLLLLGTIPALSQDFYRFIWDGLLLDAGQNPYALLPDAMATDTIPLQSSLLEKMGELSAENHSNYPPISQLGFWLSTQLFSSSILSAVVGMRLLLILSDLGIFFLGTRLLTHFQMNPHRIGWYFLHPLVIVELTGNLHGEGLMLFFFLGGWCLYTKKKFGWASLSFAAAVATKLIPLLLYPVFIRFQKLKTNVIMGLCGLTGLLLFFLPFFHSLDFSTYIATIQLWFKQFEFNGSIYYLIRSLGYQWKGYNIIRQWGEIVPWILLCWVLFFAFYKKKKTAKEIFSAMLILLSGYYFIASIVHPWYLVNLILLGVFTSYRFPMVWGGAVIVSYFTYSTPSFTENMWLIGLEYGLVYGIFWWEWRNKKALFHHFQ